MYSFLRNGLVYNIRIFYMQFIYKLYILYTNFINIYKSNGYTCIVYTKNHTPTIQKLYMTIVADVKCAPEIHESQIGSVNLCGVRRKQKKIIKISNGNECVGSGHPLGGVARCLYRLKSLETRKEARKEGTTLYYTYNIKNLHLFWVLLFASS